MKPGPDPSGRTPVPHASGRFSRPFSRKDGRSFYPESPWPRGYSLFLALLVVGGVTGVLVLFQSEIGGNSLFFLLASVVFCALRWGLVVGITTAVLASFAQNYFFQTPLHAVGVHSVQDLIELSLFILISCYLSWIGSRIRRAKTEAEEAGRAREDLLAIVSHDLKNPISAIRMNTDLVLRGARRGQNFEVLVRRSAEQIRFCTERMHRLITDLLDYEKVRTGMLDVSPRAESATALLEETRALMTPLAQDRGIRLEFTNLDAGYEPSMQAHCDRDRILQVLSNLIGNAIKFTPAGGTVRVGFVASGEGEVRYSVIDTGPGIPPESLPFIFDRYWQAAQTARQGTGLGLAISRGIVDAHGGRIWAESEVGRGSSFFFSLPLIKSTEASIGKPLRSELGPERPGKVSPG